MPLLPLDAAIIYADASLMPPRYFAMRAILRKMPICIVEHTNREIQYNRRSCLPPRRAQLNIIICCLSSAIADAGFAQAAAASALTSDYAVRCAPRYAMC